MKRTILLTIITSAMISAAGCSLNIDSLPIEVSSSTMPDTTVAESITESSGTTAYPQTSVDVSASHETTASTSQAVEFPATEADVNLQEKAEELYETAGDVYFHMIYTRDGFGFAPYTGSEVFQEVISANIVSVSENMTTIEDVKREMRKIFADPAASQYDAMIDEHFREENGKLYTYVNGKGGDVTLTGVELSLVSSNENSAQFNAVAHYDGYQDVSRPFSIICENGVWKVSEFSDPNCETNKTVCDNISENNVGNNAELTAMALNIYKEAHNMFFGLLINGTYFETNGNYIIGENGEQLDEISDVRVSSINDIKAEMNTVFSEAFSSGFYENIDRIYRESDGKIYQINQGKGSALDLDYIVLDLIYADENTLKFDVFLTAPYDSSVTSDAGQFTLINENGWKVDSFQYHL